MARRTLWLVVCGFLLWAASGSTARAAGRDEFAFTNPGDLPQLRLVDGADALPLKHTDVRASVTGLVAEVEVRQTYRNTHKEAIEAVYTFPLPENSAVRDMEIVIGDRTISAEIQRRDEARRTYEEARARGNTAALLEQERTNIFTQSVANIAPGEDIDVVVRYVQDLTYDAGEVEFVFPMVVGPRYTAHTADAARITPPVVGEGTRTGHDISVHVDIDAGMPLHDLSVPTHDVQSKSSGASKRAVTLAENKSIPNRDFVLRYRVDAAKVQSTMFVTKDGDDRFFTLLMQPPTSDVDAHVGQRELIFVVDISGSMSGTPLAMCKYAMRKALRQLRPVDTFNVITFESGTRQAFDRPVPANQLNIANAEEFIAGLRAGGGTEIINAVDAALSPPVGERRHRYVFFLTDGFVSIEEAVFTRTKEWVRALAEQGQRARVFAMGTGSSPNRELLDKLTKAGQGVPVYASNREDPARAVDAYFRYIDHAVLTDVHVQWNGANVEDLNPMKVPDLYVSRPTIMHGRLLGKAPSGVVLAGTLGETKVEIPVRIETLDADASAVQSQLWARAQIETLELSSAWDGDPRVEQITQLGLDHRLVTRYTSFVAVDTSRVVGDGDPDQLVQPIDVVEAVDMAAAGATEYSAIGESEDDVRYSDEEADYPRAIRSDGGGCAHCSVGTLHRGHWQTAALLLMLLGLRRRRQ